jgi:hypothetical protein
MFMETVVKTKIYFCFILVVTLICVVFFSYIYRCGACSWILYFQEYTFVLIFF